MYGRLYANWSKGIAVFYRSHARCMTATTIVGVMLIDGGHLMASTGAIMWKKSTCGILIL